MSLTSILDGFFAVPEPIRGLLARALGLAQIDALIEGGPLHSGSSAQALPERLLQRLAVTYRAAEQDLRHIPRSGPVVIVANHPFGILEGAVLATLLTRLRTDVRFLANDFLSRVPEIRDLLIPVDPISGSSATRRNMPGMRQAMEFLSGGGCLVVFPAGEVSHFQLRQRAIADSQWHLSVARLIHMLARQNTAASVVPAYIKGSNSILFQALGLLHGRLRTLLLARELLNKRNRSVEVRIGSPIPARKLLEIPNARERTDYLRWRTHLLAERPDFKPKTSLPLRESGPAGSARKRFTPVEAAGDPALLAREIAELSADHRLIKSNNLEVFAAPATAIPRSLREIARLREVSFRSAGEGTCKTLDTDRFDQHYLHLFAWTPGTNEVVGAYRLAGTDVTSQLYTRTLFHYPDSFLERIGPALELGRSFVRPEYQKSFSPLLALWKGIGVYIARNPRYKILFGPVSISNRYQAVSRELMVTFLQGHATVGRIAREWSSLISVRDPLRRRSRMQAPLIASLDLDDLSDIVSDLEPTRSGIPVLLRQYLKLGGTLLGFSVDPEFSDALDGLILVDLTGTDPKLLERYLGKSEAAQFLHHQKGKQHHNGT